MFISISYTKRTLGIKQSRSQISRNSDGQIEIFLDKEIDNH